MIKFSAVVLMAVLLCSCALKPFVLRDTSALAAVGSEFGPNSTIYVIRSPFGHAGFDVHLDKVEVGAVGAGTYIRFSVPPGQRELKVFGQMFASPEVGVAVQGTFDANRTYYFLFDAQMLSIHLFEYRLTQISADVAATMIKASRERPSTTTAASFAPRKFTYSEAIVLLQSSKPDELRNAARTLYAQSTLSSSDLDSVANRVLWGMGTTDRQMVDSISWLCRVLGKSGAGRYKAFLVYVSTAGADPKLREFAESAADSLPDSEDGRDFLWPNRAR
jgi:hypothetical protein